MDVRAFVDKWKDCSGGAERGNAALYLVEMLTALRLPTPDPAGGDTRENDYVFERAVHSSFDHLAYPRRIDLYKRGCFVLEAKQSRWSDRAKAAPFARSELEADMASSPGDERRWDTLMRNARQQAQDYVAALPADHPAPPFVLICDVARGFEVHADFTGTGRGFAPFPDRLTHRFSHADLVKPEIQARLRAIWTDPFSLDPSRRSAAITHDIVDELAIVSQRLEALGQDPEQVALFLMRCIFTIFAADVGLLPKHRLIALLEDCSSHPPRFVTTFEALWQRLSEPDYGRRFFPEFERHLPHIGGDLFRDTRVLPLDADGLTTLLRATRHDWRRVEPSIFGSLLEHALQPAERRRLGAHYTPPAFVKRLVEMTVMEPLREDWRNVLIRMEQARDEGDTPGAVRLVKAFHRTLCDLRILDPACGTGNFLYVAMDLLKGLECHVQEALCELGETDSLGLDTIDPGQFLGLEVNPRAAAITELVLWIGWLQLHYRNHSGHPSEPILKGHDNIVRQDAVLTWDGAPLPRFRMTTSGAVPDWPGARRPVWPQADFIVGNPPFIGGKALRSRLDPGYAEALWAAHPQMNDSADLVMYWWDHAADILSQPGTRLRRFGLVSTNSISQPFQRRTVDRWLRGSPDLSLVHAIPDHPWTRAAQDSASVQIAMTVVEAGRKEGELSTVVSAHGLEIAAPQIVLKRLKGRINPDLTLGADATRTRSLVANSGLCSPGMKLHGSGFVITPAEAVTLGLGRRPGLEAHVRPYRNGRDLMGQPRDALVIDLFGLEREEVRDRFPEIYAHLAETVREQRQRMARTSPTREARDYAARWWVFGKPRPDLRAANLGLSRYIATVETAKHRVFQFVDAQIVPDNTATCIAHDDAAVLAVLSSRFHTLWARARGGKLEDRPRYTKSICFDPFPFPDLANPIRRQLRAAGEALDVHRRTVLSDAGGLTLTGLYNLLDAVRSGAELTSDQKDTARRARIVILRELHDEIDALTTQAYGGPSNPTDNQVVAALIALNRARGLEENRGSPRWLRPGFQTARTKRHATYHETDAPSCTAPPAHCSRPAFPQDRYEQPLAIKASLSRLNGPTEPQQLARQFSGGTRLTPRINRVLGTLHRYGHVERLDDGRWIARP